MKMNKCCTILPEDVGEIHNKLLRAYFASSLPKITPENYLIQIPIADKFFLEELVKICNENNFGINSNLQSERHLIYVSETVESTKPILLNGFDQVYDNIVKISIIGYAASKLLRFYREILFKSNGNTLLASLVKFENKMRSTDLNSGEKELFISLISVTKNSYIYWTEHGGGSNPQAFIIGDCVGYLAGWGSATWDDYWNGNLNSSGQGRRIGQGMIWSAAGSVVSGPL